MKRTLTAFLLAAALIFTAGCGRKQESSSASEVKPTYKITADVESDGIYTIVFTAGDETLTYSHEDGTPYDIGETVDLCSDTSALLNGADTIEYRVSAYDENGIGCLWRETFTLDSADTDITHFIEVTALCINAEFISQDEAEKLQDDDTYVCGNFWYADGEYILVSLSQDVTDFSYYGTECDVDDDGNIYVKNYETYDTAYELPAGTALILSGPFGETLPLRAISFTDAGGITHSYYIERSGKTDEPVLDEYYTVG